MAIITSLLQSETDGSISFGDYTLAEKAKVEDFEHAGDIYKVKTFTTMTKLEKNGMFLYESVPGTSVSNFTETNSGVTFKVEGSQDAQIIVGLEENTEYEVFVAGASIGKMQSNFSGKITISVELAEAGEIEIKIVK